MTLLGLLDGIVGVLLVALVGFGLLVARRRVLTRRGGTFDCSLRLRESQHGKGWVLGVGRYAGDALEWYRAFSLSMRPRRAMPRHRLQVVERRDPTGVEAFALLSDAVVVRLRDGDGPVELAMSPDSLTGFLSWVEASPPGVPRG